MLTYWVVLNPALLLQVCSPWAVPGAAICGAAALMGHLCLLISLLPSTRAVLIPDSRSHVGIVPAVTLQALWQRLFKGD